MNTFTYEQFFSQILIGLVICTTVFSCQEQTSSAPDGFQVHPDFELSLVASEPLVFDPVDMEFDEAGRAFVLEMPGYPLRDEDSRLVLLMDENGDGIFDKRQIYADSLQLASSFMPYKGGMLVASPPYLLHLQDQDGDNVADKREILMEGFRVGNLQHNVNGLTYGLDNWIYAANGGNSGAPYFSGDDANPLVLRDDDFRFNLDKKWMERVGASSGGFELAFDNWGRMYETHNLEHVSQLVFEGKYIEGLPLSTTHSLKNISDHEENGLARIYPIGAQDTRVNHPEQSGYFSGSCGISFYGGGAFPQGYNDQLFVADVVLNLIHVDALSAQGSHSKASRIRDKQEFLASTDRSFRPVNMTTGPDGALYMMDMHRAVIEHPEWIPDELEADMDLAEGKDKGRIYRISPKAGKPAPALSLKREDPGMLIEALGSRNQWVRMTAQRLLVEEMDAENVAALESLFKHSENEFSRLHALWTLEGINELSEDLLKQAFLDKSPGVRENALRIAENHLSPELGKEIISLCQDEDPRVRLRAALSLGRLPQAYFVSNSSEIFRAFQEMLAREDSDIWVSIAAASAMQQAPLTFSSELLANTKGEMNANSREALLILCKLMARNQDLASVEAMLHKLATTEGITDKDKQQVVDAFAQQWGNQKKGIKLSTTAAASLASLEGANDPAMLAATSKFRKALGLGISPQIQAKMDEARKLVFDESKSVEERKELLALIGLDDFSKRESILYQLLDNRQAQDLQKDAMRQLWLSDDPKVGPRLLAIWPELGPEARKNAGNILLYKSYNHELLLTALEEKKINAGELNLDLERRRVLLWSENDEIKRRAEQLFSDAGVVQRKDAITRMRPALSLEGNITKGKKLFQNLCSSCHVYGNMGTEVGPVLTEISRKSKESLMHDILDPNAAADPRYLNHQVKTKDGNIYTGIIYSESDSDIILRKTSGEEQLIAKKDIDQLRSMGTSLMPEGLEEGMTNEDMADLLAFLQQQF